MVGRRPPLCLLLAALASAIAVCTPEARCEPGSDWPEVLAAADDAWRQALPPRLSISERWVQSNSDVVVRRRIAVEGAHRQYRTTWHGARRESGEVVGTSPPAMETVSSFDGARWLTVAMGREGTGRWSGFRSDICPDSGLEMSLISVAVRAAGEDIQALVRRRHVHAAGTNASGAVVLTLLANRAVSDALRSSKPVGGLLGWRATFEPARWWRPTSVEWIALASSCRFDAVATGARSLDLARFVHDRWNLTGLRHV